MDKHIKMAKKQKMASGLPSGPVNEHKMLAMGCRIPNDSTAGTKEHRKGKK